MPHDDLAYSREKPFPGRPRVDVQPLDAGPKARDCKWFSIDLAMGDMERLDVVRW